MNILKFLKSVPAAERKVFRLHLTYYSLEGFVLGVLALNEFVYLKSLKGGDWGVSLLFQFSVFVLTFSILLNEWAERVPDKRKFLFRLGIITRIPLLLLLFFPKDISGIEQAPILHSSFLLIFLVYYFANPIVYPAINRILKQNYAENHFSILYSYATLTNKIIMLAITFGYGIFLDYFPNSYRWILPLSGVISFISIAILSKIPYHEEFVDYVKKPFWRSIKDNISGMKMTLKNNKPFKDFEMGFMYYGFAFMGTVSVIAIFFNNALDLNYSSVAFYKNSYNILAIFLLPLFGRLMGKIDPRKFAALTFASLFFYLFFIFLTQFISLHFFVLGIKIYPTLLLAMIFNGVFAATMSLLWSIGSAYFCKPDEASGYQAIHLSFTGLRSFFAPILGLGVYLIIGFSGTFILGMVLLGISVFISIRSHKKHDL
jgi:MFS family permease